MLRRSRSPGLALSRSYSKLSREWIPSIDSSGGKQSGQDGEITANAKLVKAGFLRQTHAGIFHMLPLGQRVLNKLEHLIDLHMKRIGACKLSLSTISSENVWRRSGRLQTKNPELFRLQDRKGAKFLLAPTHEEEVTALVADHAHSYKDLPLRLYQISRKYRDEARPRSGLLRGREFLMKDLYTFDATAESSQATYSEVRSAYDAIFRALRVPFVTGSADSGSMGGSVSHEYHLRSPDGEDRIVHCPNCMKTMNEEVAVVRVDSVNPAPVPTPDENVAKWFAVTRDRKTLIEVWFEKQYQNQVGSGFNTVNAFAVKAALPEVNLDTSVTDPQALWQQGGSDSKKIWLCDPRITLSSAVDRSSIVVAQDSTGCPISLTSLQSGDPCQNCSAAQLEVFNAIEVGHTFNLGTRYSKPFELKVRGKDNKLAYVDMGCHGIGVSRIIAAVASIMADSHGLNWPNIIAPFSVVVIPLKGHEAAAEEVALKLTADAQQAPTSWSTIDYHLPDIALDDRDKPVGWKLKDAVLVGYPIVVVVGKSYEQGLVEVQCRQLDYKATDHTASLGLGYLYKQLH